MPAGICISDEALFAVLPGDEAPAAAATTDAELLAPLVNAP